MTMAELRRRGWRPAAGLLLASVGLSSPLAAQSRDRDTWQRVPEVIAALSIQAGSRVADVGAGSGYFTERLARTVGAAGRVFAVEISEAALTELTRLAGALAQVEVVRGSVDDPRLPEGSMDAVLVVDAYHEMTAYEAMLAGFYRALRPGGRLVILDRAPADSSLARERQHAGHRLAMSLAEQDLRSAGFEILDRQPRFTRDDRGRQHWMLVGRRPPLRLEGGPRGAAPHRSTAAERGARG
jgi:predicted methyltransferase